MVEAYAKNNCILYARGVKDEGMRRKMKRKNGKNRKGQGNKERETEVCRNMKGRRRRDEREKKDNLTMTGCHDPLWEEVTDNLKCPSRSHLLTILSFFKITTLRPSF